MQFLKRKFFIGFFVILFLGMINISASCSKNISLMSSSSQNDTLKTYLALGDSYTIGQSVNANETYPAQTVAILNKPQIRFKKPVIIAATGWTTNDLQNAVNNYTKSNDAYDFVTLLIGVNNQYQGRSQTEYADQFTALLKRSIQFAKNIPAHVIVLSIPDYSVTPFAQNSDTALIAKQIDSFNTINKEISLSYKVNYINITDESRKAATDRSLITYDSLHFSGKEYAIWAKMLADTIQTRLH